jgi:peptidoglycan/xylan/chitin deacetylase (PgdA/CDA1 family)
MTRAAYLTIDDSPTNHTDALTDFLAERDIPAVLFCIGADYKDLGIPCQGMESMPDPVFRAIQKGFLIGNHTYTHSRYSEMNYEDMVREIEKTEQIIDHLYKKAGKTRAAKLFRFRDIDRGCGTHVIDYTKAGQHADTIRDIFTSGVNLKEQAQTAEKLEKKEKLQAYLAREGFTATVYKGITFPWYTQTEMAAARDSLYTYSTSDWMLNPDFNAHASGWAYRSLDALKRKIDDDPWLNAQDSANIILAHDHNNLLDVTTSLIDHMGRRGIKFLDIS